MYINNNQFFDISREPAEHLPAFHAVLADGQLFRYVESDRPSSSAAIETSFARMFGQEAAAAVASGTVGLRLALQAVGVRPGDRVLVSAYSFIACAMSIVMTGAIPVPADMTTPLAIDTTVLERGGNDFAAVLIVHVQGHAIDVRPVRSLCDQIGIPLIEDVCQGLGSNYPGGPVGTLADVAVTSFQQSKQISSGEGGLVAGPARVIETVYRAADLGAFRLPGGMRDWDSEASVFADNLRMTELQAALIQDQAEMLSQTLTAQRSIRAALWKRLDGLPIIKSSTPEGDSGSHTLLLARDATAAAQFCQQLAASRVLARTVWKKTYLEYDLFRKWGIEEKIRPYPLPQRARLMSPRIVSVPSPKYLGSDASDQVAEAILDNAHLLAAGTDADE